jgi:foldase protein PrsA
MRKYSSRLTALGAFFVLAVAVAGCGSGVPGNSVADVAGNPITAQAFNHWMYVAAKSQASQNPGAPIIVPTDPPQFDGCVAQVRRLIPSLAKTSAKTLRGDCKQLFTSLSSQVMDFLIKGYWYQAEAARDHITVTDAQVQKAFTTAKNQQFKTPAAYQTFLSQTGQTQQDILYRFRVNQIYTKLLAKQNTKVTPSQIQQYYASHKSQFGTPQERDLRIVLTTTLAKANAAKKALQSGQSWKTVAKTYSTDASTKNSGGQLLNVIKGQQDTALDNAAFSNPTGKLVGPVKGQFGYYIVEVTRIIAAKQQSLAAATPTIRSTLTGQAQSTAQTAVDNAAKKAWLAKTQCASAYAMADCSNYKPPKTSTSTSPTSPPPTTSPSTSPSTTPPTSSSSSTATTG